MGYQWHLETLLSGLEELYLLMPDFISNSVIVSCLHLCSDLFFFFHVIHNFLYYCFNSSELDSLIQMILSGNLEGPWGRVFLVLHLWNHCR